MRTGKDCRGREYREIPVGKLRRNLIGQTFGRLTPLFRVYDEKYIYYLARCECGNLVRVRGTHLTTGETQECVYCRMHTPRLDLTGNIYGNLQVLGWSGRHDAKAKRFYWDCKCLLCGREVAVVGYNLKSGNTQSCGCSKKSWGEKEIRKLFIENNVNFREEVVFKDLFSPKGAHLRFDFGIYNEKDQLLCLVEYDGFQHFEIRKDWTEERFEYSKQCDALKDEYCKKNGIKLIRIPYTVSKFSMDMFEC